MHRARLEAFSDGVFAVAITLLALNLAVAGPGHGPLLRQLADHWPSFVAYLISFFTVGIIWVNHHALMDNIAFVDRKLLFLNLLLLLFVVAIPFATGTMADYLRTTDQDARVAMLLYALILEGMSLSFAAIFGWSLGAGRTHHPVPPDAPPHGCGLPSEASSIWWPLRWRSSAHRRRWRSLGWSRSTTSSSGRQPAANDNGRPYRPVKRGSRFSKNAATPSLTSSLALRMASWF